MKKISHLIILVVLTSNLNAQTFKADNFSIKSTCDLIAEPNYTQQNSTTNYKCADINKRVIFRVMVTDFRQELKQLNITDFNKSYIENYFREYKKNLNGEKVLYKETTFQKSYAITYSQKIQQEGSVLLKNKSIVFLYKGRSYTISVMTTPELVEEYFSTFIKTFHFLM